MTILAVAGSLRSGSVNRALIQASRDAAPEGVDVQIFDLNGLPFYNGDLDGPEDWPAEVLSFADAIRNADGVLFGTPEYNHVIPGVLGNALDWASRPLGGTAPLKGKPVAVIGASPGIIGTARAQDHLKLILMNIGAYIPPIGGLVVGKAFSKFEGGQLTDEETRARLGTFMDTFVQSIQPALEVA